MEALLVVRMYYLSLGKMGLTVSVIQLVYPNQTLYAGRSFTLWFVTNERPQTTEGDPGARQSAASSAIHTRTVTKAKRSSLCETR